MLLVRFSVLPVEMVKICYRIERRILDVIQDITRAGRSAIELKVDNQHSIVCISFIT